MAAAGSIDFTQLLNEEWRPLLEPILTQQKNIEEFLGVDRPWTIPKREDTFAALNGLAPANVRVVVFGQDPYPREESAVGIAFCDGAIKTWKDSFSPSFRNIIKNAFIYQKLMQPSDRVAKFRAVVESSHVVAPRQWFDATIAEGVLWLNTALTFSSTQQTDTKRHTAFWRPVIEAIIRCLLEAQRDLIEKGTKGGLVFVMWGGYAHKLRPVVNRLNERLGVPLEFVEAKHPAVEAFHSINTFDLVAKALTKLGRGSVDWVPKEKVSGKRAAEEEGKDGTEDNAKEEGEEKTDTPRKIKRRRKT